MCRIHNTCQIQKYWEICSVALAPSVQEVKNEKRLRLKKSIMKLLNYQISCYSVLPSVGGTNFRPKLYVYLIVSFSLSSFLSTYHPPIYFPGCNILAPRFSNTSEFDKYSSSTTLTLAITTLVLPTSLSLICRFLYCPILWPKLLSLTRHFLGLTSRLPYWQPRQSKKCCLEPRKLPERPILTS